MRKSEDQDVHITELIPPRWVDCRLLQRDKSAWCGDVILIGSKESPYRIRGDERVRWFLGLRLSLVLRSP